MDPLITAYIIRRDAAAIIRHCKFERHCEPDPSYNVVACLKTAGLQRAAEMLERRGFGFVRHSIVSGYQTFTLTARRDR